MVSKKILVTGTSGTGKTTVYRELQKRGVETIGIDETPHLSYWVHKTGEVFTGDKVDFDEKFLNNHEWICDISLLKDLLSRASGPVVVCGSCDNIAACIKLCDETLLLECSPETFISRIDARNDNEFGKSEAAKKALLGYYEAYNQECINAGAISIDAERPIDKVVEEVISHIT